MFDFNRDWGLGRLSYGGEVSNPANNSLVSSSENYTLSDTCSAHGSKKRDIWWLKHVFQLWVDNTKKVFRLSSQTRVVNFHLVGLDQDDISWNIITSLDLNQVAWHKLERRNFLPFSIALAKSHSRNEFFESGHQVVCFRLLGIGEDSCEEAHDSKNDAEVQTGNILLVKAKADETQNWASIQKQGKESSLFL